MTHRDKTKASTDLEVEQPASDSPEGSFHNGAALGGATLSLCPKEDPPPDPSLESALRTLARFMMLHRRVISEDEFLTGLLLWFDNFKNEEIGRDCKRILMEESQKYIR